jgi:putative FmdB family regulatory protein
MPLYEYQCDACEHRFEVIRKFSDAPLDTCPKCGGHVHKLFSAPAFQLKGTGWYATDFAGKGKAAAPASKAEGSTEGSKDAGKENSKEGSKETSKETSKESTSSKESSSESSKESASSKTEAPSAPAPAKP